MNWLWIKIGILSVISLLLLVGTIYLMVKTSQPKGLCSSDGCKTPVFETITLNGNELSTNTEETIAMGVRSPVVKQGTHNITLYKVGNQVTIKVPYFSTQTSQAGTYSYVKIPPEYMPKHDIAFPITLRIGGWIHMGFAAISVSDGTLTLYYSINGQAQNFPVGNIGNDTFCITYMI